MRIVFLSDTHNRLGDISVPDGDLLIHSGDFTMGGKPEEVELFNADLEKLNHTHKIVIAGNHEFMFELQPMYARRLLSAATYLQDDFVIVDGLKIYGSPWQPAFHNWAFNLPRNSPSLCKIWDKIPNDTDILVTHTPPYGILDKTKSNMSVGCEVLRQRLRDIKPRIHCFGHIHPAYGQRRLMGITFVNAALVDEKYQPANSPIVIDL